MTQKKESWSPRKLALTAAFALLGMIIFVGLAEGVALAGILVESDASATAANLVSNSGQFRFGLFAHAMVILLDVVAAWALYRFLQPVGERIALLAAWLRVGYAFFYAAALFRLAGALNGDSLQAFDAFRNTWNLGYIVFGLHLVILGWLLLRHKPLPAWISWLIIAGGISYLFDYLTLFLLGQTPVQLSLVFGFAEILLMFWFFWKGGKRV